MRKIVFAALCAFAAVAVSCKNDRESDVNPGDSDIDGLYTDDPKVNPDAELITYVEEFSPEYMEMASSAPGSEMGTGGMVTKIKAARIATASGVDMIIANGKDFGILHHIFENRFTGTFFKANYDENFDILDLLEEE